jgi:serine/threonine-protein kinase
MMARSGGFNVPADYFRSTAMPAPVPASPAGLPKKRWPLYAVIAAVGTAVGVVAVVLVGKGGGGDAAHATPSSTPAASAVATATAPPQPSAALAPAPSASAAPVLHEILVSVVPPDATLTRDGKDLGGAPVALHLGDGEVANLVITRKGYKTKTVPIDTSDPKVTITLESAFAGPARPAGGGAKPAGGGSSGGIDDVGDPFAHKH